MSEPVASDGVVTIPAKTECEKMSFDIPEAYSKLLASEMANNAVSTNNNSREVFRQAAGVLAAVITRIPSEPSVLGSRAVSGVLATPIASPTVQQPGQAGT